MLALGLLAAPACGDVMLPDDGSDPPDAGSPPPPPPPPVPPEDLSLADSFDITAELTYMDSSFPVPPGFLPDRQQFVLRLDDTGGMTEGIAGVVGQMVAPRFFHLAGGERVLESDFSLAASDGGAIQCGVGDVRYDTMTLETFDTDDDGRVDLVQGTATGAAGGLELFGAGLFTATIKGVLDTTPPRLTLRGPEIAQSVLGNLVVEASEPLPLGVRMLMTSEADGLSVDLVPFPQGQPAISSFVAPPDLLLQFSDTMRLEVLPGFEDLAGNGGTLDTPSIVTIEDPQIFPQDGFEGGGNVTFSGDASLVSSVGTVTAITGSTSILLEPSGSATLRITLPDDGGVDRKLGLQLRGLFPRSSDSFLDGDVVLVLPATNERVQQPFPEAETTTETGHPDWRHAGPVTPLELPLPAGAAGEVLVVLRLGAPSLCGDGSSSEAAVLIDDVVVLGGAAVPPQPAGAPAGR